MMDVAGVKDGLDRLAEEFGAAYLDTDPVALVHRYNDPRDCEIAGLAVSALSYGGAKQIRRSAGDMLDRVGASPAAFAVNLDLEEARRVFGGFVHRWTRGEHLAQLWYAMGAVIREHGSLGALVRSLDDPAEATIEGVMTRFAAEIARQAADPSVTGHSALLPTSLVPSPAAGSACKRHAMYFRWMVRGPDGVDLGIWPFIQPARLVVPLDRHIARMGRRLGMTRRGADDWKTALEITDALRRLDPDDPLRYDFALVRPGIVGRCAPHSAHDSCGGCPLERFCHQDAV